MPADDEEQAILVLEEEPACVGVAAYRRLRVRFFAGVVAGPAVHASTISFVAFVIAVAAWRFACPTAWPRSEPAAALAPLSHMLMNGFFFNHGLAILISLDSEAVQAFGLMGGDAARVSLPVIPRLVKPVGYDRRHLEVPAHRAQPRLFTAVRAIGGPEEVGVDHEGRSIKLHSKEELQTRGLACSPL